MSAEIDPFGFVFEDPAVVVLLGQLRGGFFIDNHLAFRMQLQSGGGDHGRNRPFDRFGEDGRLAGLGGCNNYSASYEQEADKLSFGASISTRMACAPALMDQESRFFRLLEKVERFEFDSTGALILHGSDGGTILARR